MFDRTKQKIEGIISKTFGGDFFKTLGAILTIIAVCLGLLVILAMLTFILFLMQIGKIGV